jgi:hypothetical protein
MLHFYDILGVELTARSAQKRIFCPSDTGVCGLLDCTSLIICSQNVRDPGLWERR